MSNTPTDTDRTRDTAETRTGDRNRDAGRNGSRDANETRDVLDTDVMRWLSALVALAGLALVASPFLFEATETATWNNVLVGAAIAAVAGYNFVRMTRNRLASVGLASLAVLLGLWALVSPYLLEMGSNELTTATGILGALAAGLSAYNAYANNKADATERTPRSA